MAASSPTSQASTSSASSQPRDLPASAILNVLATTGATSASASTGVSKEIEDLLETQRKIRAQRAQVTKDLKNAQRRKQRLKHKARLLTASDLASVLVLRQEEEAAKQNRPKRRRSSQPAADATPPATGATPPEGARVEEEAGEGDEESDPEDLADETRAEETPPVA